MRLRESLEAVAAISPEAFEDLRRNVDPEWILQALEGTGTATLRTRRLPAEQVVWLVIGMALFRNRSIHDVVSKLDLALPGNSLTVAPSTVVEARARLGAEPDVLANRDCPEGLARGESGPSAFASPERITGSERVTDTSA